jgi:Flp pilus assembly protein TadG
MRRITTRLRRLFGARDGAAAVEFALVFPVAALFLIGAIEFGRLFWMRSLLEHAVEETGRYAMAHTTAAQSELTGVLQQRAAAALAASAIGITYATAATGGTNYLTITATYSFGFMTNMIPYGPITLQSQTRVPLLS